MARQLRIDFPGAFHHVMNRGAARQITFRNDGDRALFLKLWSQASSRFGIEVLAYALMGNHYHVFVHSPDGQLSATMRFIGQMYTQSFNHYHERDGALFRGRFHSIIVDSDMYFARVARYIELNPVKAGLCSIDELDRYQWSSFKYYSEAERTPDWLSTRHLLERFGSADEYRSFIGAEAPDRELDGFYRRALRSTRVLGDAGFVEKLGANHPDFGNHLEAGMGRTTVEDIEMLIMAVSGASLHEILISSQSVSTARKAALVLAQELTDGPRSDLARRYGFSSPSAFTNAVLRIKTGSASEEFRWLHATVRDRLG